MKVILIACTFFLSTAAFAFDIQYCMNLKLTDSASKQTLSKARCEVLQTFDEQSSAAKWSCSFNSKGVEVLNTQADRVGANSNWGNYSEYLVFPGSELGQYLFKGLEMIDVSNNRLLQTRFGEGEITLTENPLPYQTAKGLELLLIEDIQYGACN